MNKKTIKTLEALKEAKLIHEEELPQLKKVVNQFSLTISNQMQTCIDATELNDPIAKQFVPDIKELDIADEERADPIGDDVYTTVKGIVHRYPDRCLLMPVPVCAVYCRFCFRREKISHAKGSMTPADFETAYAYLNTHSEIWEVIITGGDPFILKPAKLQNIIQRLSDIPHIEVIRIHTRIPIVESNRMTTEMINALKCEKTVYVAIHANHPHEFTQDAIRACAQLADAGIPLLSQTTLLKDINDDIDVLSQLMRLFVKHRIKPYYLHHGDLARGTKHFRTSIAHGQQLMKQLRRRFSGLCQPTYVLDIPGGYGKIPIHAGYIQEKNTDAKINITERNMQINDDAHVTVANHHAEYTCYCLEDHKGNLHEYVDYLS